MATTLFDVLLTLAHRMGRFSEGVATAAGATSVTDATLNQATSFWVDGTILIQTTNGSTVCKVSRRITASTSAGVITFATVSPTPTTGATFTVVHKRVPRAVMIEAVNTGIRAIRQGRAAKKLE